MFKETDLALTPEESPREALLRAKAEMYFDRAAERFAEGRLLGALKELDRLAAMEHAHAQGLALRQRVEERLQELSKPRIDGKPLAGARRPEIVLIVDQDIRVLAGMAEALRSYGFTTLGAGTYEEAVASLSLCVPDVVISEVNFESGPRGVDFYQEFRTMHPGHDPVFIFLSARMDKELELAGLRLGIDAFVVKPFEHTVLSATVLRFLSRRSRPAISTAV